MAAPMVQMHVLEEFLDHDEDIDNHDDDDIIPIVLALYFNRRTVPKIENYAERVIPMFTLDDFRQHFRISRTTFEIILQQIGENLSTDHSGGNEPVEVSKQLFIFMWILSNTTSMREVSQMFGVSKWTVHQCCQKVAEALLLLKVSWQLHNFEYNKPLCFLYVGVTI